MFSCPLVRLGESACGPIGERRPSNRSGRPPRPPSPSLPAKSCRKLGGIKAAGSERARTFGSRMAGGTWRWYPRGAAGLPALLLVVLALCGPSLQGGESPSPPQVKRVSGRHLPLTGLAASSSPLQISHACFPICGIQGFNLPIQRQLSLIVRESFRDPVQLQRRSRIKTFICLTMETFAIATFGGKKGQFCMPKIKLKNELCTVQKCFFGSHFSPKSCKSQLPTKIAASSGAARARV